MTPSQIVSKKLATCGAVEQGTDQKLLAAVRTLSSRLEEIEGRHRRDKIG
jgi:hypothetical protein